MLNSLIDPTTLKAYEETEYHVHGDELFTLHVGQFCPALAAAQKKYQSDCSAYVTAFNPFSEVVDDAINAERHVSLARELSRRSLSYLEGVGQHPSNKWPGEVSYLIFGLTLEAAKILGTRLGQNAIVWSGADATPQLAVLR